MKIIYVATKVISFSNAGLAESLHPWGTDGRRIDEKVKTFHPSGRERRRDK